ncbi:MAG: hypothetical protein V1725_05975 [archaeon]
MLTIDTLIEGLANEKEYRDCHEDLKSYHAGRADVLRELFGIDYAQAKQQLVIPPALELPVFFLERTGERDMQAMVRTHLMMYGSHNMYDDQQRLQEFIDGNLALLAQNLSPYSIFLEGRDHINILTWKKEDAALFKETQEKLHCFYKNNVKRALCSLFPGLEKKEIPDEQYEQAMREKGLSLQTPDVNDYV